jgi:hypothetical protein
VDAVCTVPTATGVFYVLGSGGSAAAELLSSPRMAELLKDSRSRCDFVLLDAPSFPLASDALVLAQLSDVVLSVFRLQNSSRKLSLEHMRGLSAVAPAYALVVNDVGTSSALSKPERKPFAWRPQTSPVPAKEAAVVQRWWRGRSAWWLSVVLLLASGALFLLARTPLTSLASQTASELRQ